MNSLSNIYDALGGLRYKNFEFINNKTTDTLYSLHNIQGQIIWISPHPLSIGSTNIINVLAEANCSSNATRIIIKKPNSSYGADGLGFYVLVLYEVS